MRRWWVAGSILLWALSPATAGAGGGGSICAGFGSGSSIEMRDNCFAATAQFVGRGEVVVRNGGQLEHNLTAVDGSFTTGPLRPGQEARLTLPAAGTFRYYCTLHGTAAGVGMTGVLVVGDQTVGTALVSASSARAAAEHDGIRINSFSLGALAGAAVIGAVLFTRRRARTTTTA